MRNGLDISGASELVHEIGDKPIEAVIDFNTLAVPALGGAEVTVRTAHHGTQRMARSFRLPFTEHSAHAFGGLSAYEAAVAALGACVLITHVHGYTARAVTITTLKVTVTASVEVDRDGVWIGDEQALHDIHYLIEADCEGQPDSIAEVSRFVSCFSPNHRAFLDEGRYQLAAVAVDADGTASAVELDQVEPAAAGSADRTLTVKAELTWEYGTEAHVTTGFSPGGELRRSAPALTVDQSKQMLGIDCGANPQEVLLSAISADLTQQLGNLARERGIDLGDVEVEASGRLDIRGMLNVSPDIPARFHNIRILVRANVDAGSDVLAELVRQAAARNVVLAVITRAGSIDVDVHTPAGPLANFRSDADHVAAFLAEVARKQAAMAANNALQSEG